ncbi:MAG: tetratricopeptide repeat protein [Thermodesulfobacteriota bacterium]
MKKTFIFKFFLFAVLFFNAQADASVIERISLLDNGGQVAVSLDSYADFRVYQSGEYEFVVIFKDTDLLEDAVTGGSGGNLISKIVYENFSDNNSMLTIETKNQVESIDYYWDSGRNTLRVNISTDKIYYSDKSPAYKNKKRLPEKTSAEKETKQQSEQKSGTDEKETEIKTVEIDDDLQQEDISEEDDIFQLPGAGREERVYKKGGINTITDALKNSNCADMTKFKVALRLCDEKNWAKALDTAEAVAEDDPPDECVHDLAFLNAYIRYRIAEEEGVFPIELKKHLESLVNKEYTPLLPYGYAMSALINKNMGNYPYAVGYFEIIERNYPDYDGLAEVYYHLGDIYNEKEELRPAENYLARLVNNYPDTKYAQDAKLIQGEIMYSKKRYFDTIRTLEPITKESPRLLYENPDILDYVANSYFKTGSNEKARTLFSRIINIFPEVEDKDIILTNIGNTFENQGEKDKALKMYRLVTDRYPGTRGFVRSSLKIAENMDNDEQRKIVYQMIINDFPDTAEARIALIRLAEIQYEESEYDKSIDSIKALLAENPRALRTEALNIMSKSLYEKLENVLKEDNYPTALRIVEKERFYIADMKNYNINYISGKIYFKTHMYIEAEERLEKAYDLWHEGKLPVEVLRYRAFANKELNEIKKASEFADEILEKYKSSDDQGWAFELKGDIEKKKENYEKSMELYDKAVSEYEKKESKAGVSSKKGDLSLEHDRYENAEKAYESSLDIYKSLNQENFVSEIAYAAGKLAESRLHLKDFEGAVKACETALDAEEGVENMAELRFNYAEALSGLGNKNDALVQYNNVLNIDTDDELWRNMAEQRIREIELEQEINGT